jgi:two-component system phosphate regulon response regulator PhoB
VARVLVVDSNSSDRQRLCEQLAAAGFDAVPAAAGTESIRVLDRSPADLIVTEWMLPDMSGLELATLVHSHPNGVSARVLMVSTRLEGQHIARALASGVDDYVPKPADPDEFVARAWAALRRPRIGAVNGALQVGPVRLDQVAHKFTVSGREIELAPVEFRLMAFFMQNPGRVLGRSQLLEQVWNRRGGIGERTVDVHVRRLRAALEPHGCENLLQTVRGFGYRFG